MLESPKATYRTSWPSNFPPVLAQADYKVMVAHPAYIPAKIGESNEAAFSLVSDLIADECVEHVKYFLGESCPRVVPVHAQEMLGKNKIPMAYAEVLSEVLRLDSDPGIIQTSIVDHSGAASIYHRFAIQPIFSGYVEPNIEYLVVDDTCTAGGTLANLKGFIEFNGGSVILMSVLALGASGRPYDIALAPETLLRLKYRHRSLDQFWREEFGHGLETLTEGEAGHLLAAPSVDTIRNRLIEARRDFDLMGDERADIGTEATPDEGDDGPGGARQ